MNSSTFICMLSYFSVDTKYDNYYDNARLKITWRLNLILLFFLPPLFTVLYKMDVQAAAPTLVGWLFCLVLFFVIKQTQKFYFTAIVHSILGSILCLYTLIFLPESYHFVDVVWMLIIILHAYFTLGKKWGTGILLFSLLGTLYFLLFVLETNIELVDHIPKGQIYALAMNFAVCTLIIGYYIRQFLKVNKKAEDKYVALTKQLQEKNEEKSVLLREIHHRVKNNLQVITSLLRLQSEDIVEEEYKEMYSETINRVIAMSMIHDRIFESPDLAKIDLEHYIQELLKELVYSNTVSTKIDLSVSSNLKHITAKSLVPIALIFNELITNSIKHAFAEREQGKIDVIIHSANGQLTVQYKDDGQWKNPESKGSLGLELIDSLTSQLNGEMVLDRNDDSTVFNFTFKSGLEQ